jgi:NAD(P)-dependent dehydrogenase (short-subunit alcohol dehydrogenase family)
MKDLDGLRVAITGGAGDIGVAVITELVGRGASITVIDRKPEEDAENWLSPVRAVTDPQYLVADVCDRDALTDAIEQVTRLDIAIGNAGIIRSAPFLDMAPEEWQSQVDVNMTGCFNFGQLAARHMVKHGRKGSMIFTGTWIQEVPWPRHSGYSASKAGMAMLAKSMARELAAYGIRVNVVAPGILNTGLAREAAEADPEFDDKASRVVPLGYLQTPEHVAQAMAFLASPAADYITGTVLTVDGGCSLFQSEPTGPVATVAAPTSE